MSHGNSQGEGKSLVTQDKSQDKGEMMLMKTLWAKSKSQGKSCELRQKSRQRLVCDSLLGLRDGWAMNDFLGIGHS